MFESALTLCVQSLCELRAPECVLGMYHWCKDVTGKSMTWILAAQDLAYRRYEKAAVDFKAALKVMMCEQQGQGEEDAGEEGQGHLKVSPRDSPRRSVQAKGDNKVKSWEYQTSTLSFVNNQVQQLTHN